MPRPDRSKIVDLFNIEPVEVNKFNRPPAPSQRRKPKQEKQKSNTMSNNKERFLQKLEDEAFHDFDHKDWYQYFVWKAGQHGIRYLTRNYAKDYAIIKSVMTELDCMEIKSMIDFLFDSDQDMIQKQTVGIWALSKGWINSVYQSSQLWLKGEYRPKKAPKRNREWIDSSTNIATGITYGSPVKQQETKEPVRKKGSIRL